MTGPETGAAASRTTTFKSVVAKFKQLSTPMRAVVFIVVFGLIGSVLLLITHADTTTITFSGSLSASQPSVSYQVTSRAAGTITAKANFNHHQAQATLQLLDSNGVTIATKTGTTPVVVSTTAQAGIYTVKLLDANGRTRSYSLNVTLPIPSAADAQAPTAPTGLTSTVSGSSVALTWSPSSDNVGVTGYNVYRNGTKLGSTGTISYTDNSVPSGSYAYTVAAYDAAGNTSASSAQVAVTLNPVVITPPPTTGSVLFDGRFANLGIFANNVATPSWPSSEDVGTGSQITVYDANSQQPGWPAPYKWSTKAAAFTSVNDNTHYSVRTQVHGAAQKEGTDIYYSWAIYVPSSIANNWPTAGYPDWFVVQQTHGAPYNGSPAVATEINKINNVVYLDGGAGWTTGLWKTPLKFDTWMTVVQHVKFSKDPTVGVSEVWVDGVKQSFARLPGTGSQQMSNYNTTGQSLSTDGTTAHVATMLSDSAGADELYLNNYRIGQGSLFGTGAITIFHAGMKVGSSYSAVAP